MCVTQKYCPAFTTNQANLEGPTLQALREGTRRHRKESQNFATPKKEPNKRAAQAEPGKTALAGESRASSRKIRRHQRQTGGPKNKVVFTIGNVIQHVVIATTF